MSYEVISKFNSYESEIYNLCCEQKIDYEKIDYLLKHGASANAVKITKFNDGYEDKELLFVECILADKYSCCENYIPTIDKKFYLKLLNIFIDNGLDVDKYADLIFSYIHFTYDDKACIEMTKTILNHIKNKDNINFENSLDDIATEASYNDCCVQNHKYANNLSLVGEMIEKFSKNGTNPNNYYECDKVLNQTINNVKIFCKDIKIDQPKKFICDDIDIFIECEKDVLCIINEFVFVNNNDIISNHDLLEGENSFGNSLKEYVKNEKILDIIFKDCPIKTDYTSTVHTTIIIIKLTNDKSIKIKTDETVSFMKILLK